MSDTWTITRLRHIGVLGAQAFALIIGVTGGSMSAARADAIPTRVTYFTGGVVKAANPDDRPFYLNDNNVKFVPVTEGEVAPGQDFSIGKFTVHPSINGANQSYLGVPFEIGVDLVNSAKSEFAITVIRGHLDGILKGDATSLLKATIDSVTPPNPMFSWDTRSAFGPLATDRSFVLTTVPGGEGEFQFRGHFQTVPEPTVAAIMGVIGVIYARSRWRRFRRRPMSRFLPR